VLIGEKLKGLSGDRIKMGGDLIFLADRYGLHGESQQSDIASTLELEVTPAS
jgi:hypothetical protein